MLNKVADNSYQFAVNVRESFTYTLDFEGQNVSIDYYCKTDNYHFITSYKFYDFCGQSLVESTDYDTLAKLVYSTIQRYIMTNVISGSTRRAFLDFQQQLCALYTNFNLAQMLIV